MGTSDIYDEVASTLLLTDVELGLTFIRVAFSYPEGSRRNIAIRRAEEAYQKICELKAFVQMTAGVRAELSERLETLRAALEEANQSGSIAPSPR